MTSGHHDPRRPKREVSLTVSGFHCTNCALSLERHLAKVGASEPRVDFATGRTSFEVPTAEALPSIIESIKRLGYEVSETATPSHHPRDKAILIKTVISALLTTPLFLGMALDSHTLHNPFVQLVLATPVFLIGITHFGASGIRSIRGGAANMDLLIACGILSGYSASILSLVFNLGPGLIFFEAVASIVTFILIGHLLEERAVQKTTSAIQALSKLHPTEARRISTTAEGGTVVETVPVTALAVGDTLQVNLGDKVPADGVITSGGGALDESMITGESTPVDKQPGDRVTGGTVLLRGSLTVQATALGDDTVLAGIVRLVQDASHRRPHIQRVGDAVSSIFVPTVLGIAVLTLVGGIFVFGVTPAEALVRALAIVVVACPCAMGLATPTAIMVALGRAAHSGILIRGGDTLERCAQITQLAFDKTGTLTKGELTVGELRTYGHVSDDEARAIILALQRGSSHPIAKSIVSAYQSSAAPAVALYEVTEMQGVGVTGRDERGSVYVCGGRRVAADLGIASDDDIILTRDGALIASLRIHDAVRPEARAVVASLKTMGISAALISGDTTERCRALASDVSITEVYAEQSPHEKLITLRSLMTRGTTAYIGDGINDAPALAEASVGISLSSASEIAMQSAQVILTGGNLAALPQAIKLSRITVRTIRQNLFWAFAYNIATIPLAAAGQISPLAGALLMTASDVIIIGNSLRIKYRSLRS